MRRRMAGLAAVIAAVACPAWGAPAKAVEVEPGVEWTTIVRDNGPVRINVLAVDPARVRGVLSNDRIARREKVSAMSRRVAAVAGVNGGYFAPSGDPVGVLAIDGELLSESVDRRSALIVPALPAGAQAAPPAAPFIAPVRFRGRVTVNGRSREIDGIDRTRGLIPACGGRGGDQPTIRPNSVLTCGDASELVVLTRRYGARPPREGGVEAVIRDGRVTHVRPPGSGPVPRASVLLTGTGDAARFLRDVALPRSPASLSLRLAAGRSTFELAPGGAVAAAGAGAPGGAVAGAGAGAPGGAVTGAGAGAPGAKGGRAAGDGAPGLSAPAVVVGGGPRLLRAGRVAVTAAAEGFRPPQAPAFFRSFVAGRQPRTLVGVRADGTLLLVTVDGRLPGWSVGMTLPEAARLMRSLGARDALNLDGGGSTTMVVRGEVVNRPADRVERRVSDGLFVLP